MLNFFGFEISISAFIFGTITAPLTYLFLKKLFHKFIMFINNRKV